MCVCVFLTQVSAAAFFADISERVHVEPMVSGMLLALFLYACLCVCFLMKDVIDMNALYTSYCR